MKKTAVVPALIGQLFTWTCLAFLGFALDSLALRVGSTPMLAIACVTVGGGRLALLLAWATDLLLCFQDRTVLFSFTIFFAFLLRPLVFHELDERTTEMEYFWSRTGLPTFPLYVLVSVLLHFPGSTTHLIWTSIRQTIFDFRFIYVVNSAYGVLWAFGTWRCMKILSDMRMRSWTAPLFRAVGKATYDVSMRARYRYNARLRKSNPVTVSKEPAASPGNPGMETLNSFVHSKLHRPKEIRLLQLLPRGNSDEMSCHLIHASLETAPPYEAVSYTWGSSIKTDTITINGHPFRVTHNAFALLKNRSPIWVPRLLWIDSVCINQDDDEEKSQQVQLMHDIYRLATKVVVWLGDPPSADLAMDLLLELHYTIQMYRPSDHDLCLEYILERGSARWLALNDLFNHPYFKRSWVIQEVALNRRVYICYGQYLFSWDTLVSLVSYIIRQFDFSLFLEHIDTEGQRGYALLNVAHVPEMDKIRESVQRGQLLALDRLLVKCHTFDATDPRDKVFALCGIATNERHPDLLPDYTKSVVEVFTDAARFFLSTHDSIGTILPITGIGWPRNVLGMPSWVPDWSIVGRAYLDDDGTAFRASGSCRQSYELQVGSNTILLRAVLVDTIRSLGAPYENWDKHSNRIKLEAATAVTKNWLREVHSMVERSPNDSYRTGQPLSEALWRTLIVDHPLLAEGKFPIRRPAPMEYSEYYHRALKLLDRQQRGSLPDGESLTTSEMAQFRNASRWITTMQGRCSSRRFCVTSDDFIGLVPSGTELGM